MCIGKLCKDSSVFKQPENHAIIEQWHIKNALIFERYFGVYL